jgi:hypothetical protein
MDEFDDRPRTCDQLDAPRRLLFVGKLDSLPQEVAFDRDVGPAALRVVSAEAIPQLHRHVVEGFAVQFVEAEELLRVEVFVEERQAFLEFHNWIPQGLSTKRH